MASQNTKPSSKKPKLVRDSFTIPKTEFAAIDLLKTRAIALGTSVKKSELLRAGLMLLTGLNDGTLKAALAAVPTLKTGRPAAPVQAKPAAKPVIASKPEAKVAKSKPVPAKPAVKKAPAPTKTSAKAAAKPAPKPVAKPVAKPAAKPAVKAATKSAVKAQPAVKVVAEVKPSVPQA
jgi:outer membrane biosynthesis protein TonB